MIVAINDEQETSMMVEHQASRGAELAIGFAMLLGANRELDSSIGIKRMIAHLPKINLSLSLSLSLNDKEMRHEARECEQERQREQRSNERRDEQKTKEQRTALPLVFSWLAAARTSCVPAWSPPPPNGQVRLSVRVC